MLEKLFTKIYIFVFAVIFSAVIIYINIFMDTNSQMVKMSLTLLILTFFIVLFFDLVRTVLTRERGSYRTMVIERPLFNPKGKSTNLKLTYPLYPRFIALYFDKTGDSPENYELSSIQAVRYENGYLTDGLFLPIRRKNVRNRKRDLDIDDAFRYLMTYTKDFPLVVHELDYANSFILTTTNNPMLMYAVDTQNISKMIYPKLKNFGIEDINDHLNFEVDDEDPIYGAKIVAAVYLDYLRLNKYKTNVTLNPISETSDLTPVYPEEYKGEEAIGRLSQDSWQDDISKYEIKDATESDFVKVADLPSAEDMVPESNSDEATKMIDNPYEFKDRTYIGPFTPVDENGEAIIEATSEEIPTAEK